MDWMYANCSATAQRGALDWRPKFKDATLPVFTELYNKVKSGEECVRVLESTGSADYKVQLEKELKELRESEIWATGEQVRKLRPL
jgi:ketol-acid reductoisomerase